VNNLYACFGQVCRHIVVFLYTIRVQFFDTDQVRVFVYTRYLWILYKTNNKNKLYMTVLLNTGFLVFYWNNNVTTKVVRISVDIFLMTILIDTRVVWLNSIAMWQQKLFVFQWTYF